MTFQLQDFYSKISQEQQAILFKLFTKNNLLIKQISHCYFIRHSQLQIFMTGSEVSHFHAFWFGDEEQNLYRIKFDQTDKAKLSENSELLARSITHYQIKEKIVTTDYAPDQNKSSECIHVEDIISLLKNENKVLHFLEALKKVKEIQQLENYLSLKKNTQRHKI